jgi:hypothetical protein
MGFDSFSNHPKRKNIKKRKSKAKSKKQTCINEDFSLISFLAMLEL